jgi:hypothetical protein
MTDPTTQSMVERVAMAILAEEDRQHAPRRNSYQILMPTDKMSVARAAIKAMRGLTLDMIIAALAAQVRVIKARQEATPPPHDPDVSAAYKYMDIGALMRSGDEIEAAWNAAVDAALEDSPK